MRFYESRQLPNPKEKVIQEILDGGNPVGVRLAVPDVEGPGAHPKLIKITKLNLIFKTLSSKSNQQPEMNGIQKQSSLHVLQICKIHKNVSHVLSSLEHIPLKIPRGRKE